MTETVPLLPNKVYHIFNHANGDEIFFRSDENYRFFLERYAKYIHGIAETYAYCLMPNHFHLMVKIRTESEILEYFKLDSDFCLDLSGFENLTGLNKNLNHLISKQFSNFFNSYSKAYNKMYSRRGSLFERQFKRKAVSDDIYFTKLIAYIHLNPVKHGFCKQILDWQYSSIHVYYQNKNTKVNRQYLQGWLGNKEGIVAFHNSLQINDIDFEF